VERVTGLKRTSDLIRITVEGDKEYNGKASGYPSMYYFSMGKMEPHCPWYKKPLVQKPRELGVYHRERI
jgi:hypothetical protein